MDIDSIALNSGPDSALLSPRMPILNCTIIAVLFQSRDLVIWDPLVF